MVCNCAWRTTQISTGATFFFLQAEVGIRDYKVTGVQTCALPICKNIRTLAPAQIMVVALIMTGMTSRLAGQVTTKETAIQRATEQFESTPLKTTTLSVQVFIDRKSVV